LVDELVREGIDVLVAIGPAATVVPITQHVVPVVFGVSNDPVLFGLVASLARPGGNATGVTQLMYELAGKRLDILRQLAPGTRRTAVLYSPPLHAGDAQERTVIEQSAAQLGIETIFHVVRDRTEVLAAFSSAETSKCDSVLCFHGPVTFANRAVIAERAIALRLASAFSRREFCEAGGLVSYGPNIEETYGRLAYFVQRIANGARAGELPVERPTAIETVINRKTANSLGLSPPSAVLMAADEVIE
jgi:putative ABC transport system substrate-binding protein